MMLHLFFFCFLLFAQFTSLVVSEATPHFLLSLRSGPSPPVCVQPDFTGAPAYAACCAYTGTSAASRYELRHVGTTPTTYDDAVSECSSLGAAARLVLCPVASLVTVWISSLSQSHPSAAVAASTGYLWTSTECPASRVFDNRTFVYSAPIQDSPTVVRSSPIPRSSFGLVTFPDSDLLLLLGGAFVSGSPAAEIWSTTTAASWVLLVADVPWPPRQLPACGYVHGQLLLVGGYDGTRVLSDVWRSWNLGFDWVLVHEQAPFGALQGLARATYKDVLYIIGMAEEGKEPFWRTADAGTTWSPLPPPPSRRHGLRSMMLGIAWDTVFLLGGLTDQSVYTNEAWAGDLDGTSWSNFTGALPGTDLMCCGLSLYKTGDAFGPNGTLVVVSGGRLPSESLRRQNMSMLLLDGPIQTGGKWTTTMLDIEPTAWFGLNVFASAKVAIFGGWTGVEISPRTLFASLSHGVGSLAWYPLQVDSPFEGRGEPSLAFVPTTNLSDGVLVLAGGQYNADTVLGDSWISTDGGANWLQSGTVAARAGHGVVTIIRDSGNSSQRDCTIYIVAGRGAEGTLRSDVQTLNCSPWLRQGVAVGMMQPSTVVWKSITNGAAFGPLCSFGLVHFGDEMILFGGSEPQLSNKVWSSKDGVDWSLVTTAPWQPRCCFAFTSVGNSTIVLAAGRIDYNHAEASLVNDVWISFDRGATWTRQADPPWYSRSNATMVVTGDSVLILQGGFSASQIFYDMWQSMDLGQSWILVSNTMAGMSPGVVVAGMRLTYAGGYYSYEAASDSVTHIDYYPVSPLVPPVGPAPQNVLMIPVYDPILLCKYCSLQPYQWATFSTHTRGFAIFMDSSASLHETASNVLHLLGDTSMSPLFAPDSASTNLIDLDVLFSIISSGLNQNDTRNLRVAHVAATAWYAALLVTSAMLPEDCAFCYAHTENTADSCPEDCKGPSTRILVLGGLCVQSLLCFIDAPKGCFVLDLVALKYFMMVRCAGGALYRFGQFNEQSGFVGSNFVEISFPVPLKLQGILQVTGLQTSVAVLVQGGSVFEIQKGLQIRVPGVVTSMASSCDFAEKVCLVTADGRLFVWSSNQQFSGDESAHLDVVECVRDSNVHFRSCSVLPSDTVQSIVVGIDAQGNPRPYVVPIIGGSGFIYPQDSGVADERFDRIHSSLMLFQSGLNCGALAGRFCWNISASPPSQFVDSNDSLSYVDPAGVVLIRAGCTVHFDATGCFDRNSRRGSPLLVYTLPSTGKTTKSQPLKITVGQFDSSDFVLCGNLSAELQRSCLDSFSEPFGLGYVRQTGSNDTSSSTVQQIVRMKISFGPPASILVHAPAALTSFGDPIRAVTVLILDSLNFTTSCANQFDRKQKNPVAPVATIFNANSDVPIDTVELRPEDTSFSFLRVPASGAPGVSAIFSVILNTGVLKLNATFDVQLARCQPSTDSFFDIDLGYCRQPCPRGFRCDGTSHPSIRPGFWRPSGIDTISNLDSCKSFVHSCVGWNGTLYNATESIYSNHSDIGPTGNDLCTPYSEGPLCGSCSDGYILLRSFRCAPCGHLGPLYVTIFVIVLFAVVLGLSMLHMYAAHNSCIVLEKFGLVTLPGKDVGLRMQANRAMALHSVRLDEDEDMVKAEAVQGTAERKDLKDLKNKEHATKKLIRQANNSSLAAFYLKLLINYVQSSSAILEAVEYDWNGPIDSLAQAKLALFDSWDTNSFRCLFGTSSTGKASTVLTSSVVILTFVVIVFLFRKKSRVVYRALQWWPRKHPTVMHGRVFTLGNLMLAGGMTFMYTLYPSVVQFFVESMICVTAQSQDADGHITSYMLSDMQVECRFSNPRFMFIQSIAVIGLLLIGLGFPLVLLITLIRNKDKLFTSPSLLARLGFLFRGYRQEVYYFEPIVQMGRGLSMLALAASEPSQQLYFVSLLVAAELALTLWLRPYEGGAQRLQLSVLSLTLLQITTTSLVSSSHRLPSAFAYFLGLFLFFGDVIVITIFVSEPIGEFLEFLCERFPRFKVVYDRVRLRLHLLFSKDHDCAMKTNGVHGFSDEFVYPLASMSLEPEQSSFTTVAVDESESLSSRDSRSGSSQQSLAR